MPAPNLETVSVFGIVARCPFCKSTCPQHRFTGPGALVPFHFEGQHLGIYQH